VPSEALGARSSPDGVTANEEPSRGPADDRAIAGLAYARILALEGYPDGSDTPVYLSGSIVTPLANPWSDVDVFVLSDRGPRGPSTLTEGRTAISLFVLDDRGIDYEFWPPAAARALAERLTRLELGVATHTIRQLFTYTEECFVHRLRVGIPMLNADVRAFQALFDFEKFALYQAQEVIRTIQGVHQDACGMLEVGDLASAVFSARHVVELAVDAYLHKRGSTDPATKWRSRYLELFDDGSAFHRGVVEAYWRLEFTEAGGRGADPAARRRYVEECLLFSRQVTSWAQP
jgi:Nucleotidyltransferase domain